MAHEGDNGGDNWKDKEKGDGVVGNAAFDHVADEMLHEIPRSKFSALGGDYAVSVSAFFEGENEIIKVGTSN